MADPHGRFVWYELMTGDADAAARFYADVAGWTIAPSGMPGVDYRILSAPDGDRIGGMMQPPPEGAGPTMWRGYISVDDVDAAVAAIVAAGGVVHMAATDIAAIGRFAMLADPQGATFYVMHGSDAGPSRAFQPAEGAAPGHVVWNELTALDPDAALAFYIERFNWAQQGSMPMGPLGEYRFLQHGADAIGALMGELPGGRPGWQFYVHTPDVDAGVARITGGGGTVIQGPDQIPGGDYAVVAEDPQGARFGLVGPRTE